MGVTAALPPSGLHGQAAVVQHINPPGLSRPTGYTHVTLAPSGRTLYIAGQVSLDSTGRVVGSGDFRAQTERVFANLEVALRSAGATFADVVKLTTFVTDIAQLAIVREVRGRYLQADRSPASTLVQVQALARPEFLIEIEAIAVLPDAHQR
ncbi:MAG TPA: RidA family protein [Gemmatimonadales bacterium]|nr:RidA family protein [Gemmatimonadales bacterium]